MMLYLLAVRTVAISMAHLFSSRHLAAGFTGLCAMTMALASGYLVHFGDLGNWTSWLKYASPQWWINHPVVQDELKSVKQFMCTNNPTVKTEIDIIRKVDCGIDSGEQAIEYFDFTPKFFTSEPSGSVWFSPTMVPVLITVLFYVLFQLLGIVFFLGKRQVSKLSRAKKHRM